MRAIRMVGLALLLAAPLAAQQRDPVIDLQASCTSGNGKACVHLADLYAQGIVVPGDIPHAEQLALAGCDLEAPEGCTQLGKWLMYGLYRTADPGRAIELFRRACKGLDANGCDEASLAYERGSGVIPSVPLAIRYAIDACDFGSTAGCFRLGVRYEQGDNVMPSGAKAAGYFTQGCNLDDANSCLRAAALYEFGRAGLPPNMSTAIAYYKRACLVGNSSACQLALLKERGVQ